LWSGGHGPHFDEAEAQAAQRIDVVRVLVEPGCQPNTIRKAQAEKLGLVGVCKIARNGAGHEAQQRIASEQIPQPQRSQRNGLRPVRVEPKQPGPDQAIQQAVAIAQVFATFAAARSNGSPCTLIPVAARTALATAGAIGGVPGSPTPDGGFVDGTM